MASSFFLLWLLVCVAYIHSQSFNYSNFKDLGISLPITLQQHISAIYNNKLYIFGGKNGSIFDNSEAGLNELYWSLDLSSLNLQLSSSNNDIDLTQLNTAVSWQELTVTPPSYGPSSSGHMRCIHQCSTLINNFLYIIAPFGSSQSASGTVYRLDLSQDPPVYSAENDFASSINSVIGNANQPCVTSSNDAQSIYLISDNRRLAKYDVTTDSFSSFIFSLHSAPQQHKYSDGAV